MRKFNLSKGDFMGNLSKIVKDCKNKEDVEALVQELFNDDSDALEIFLESGGGQEIDENGNKIGPKEIAHKIKQKNGVYRRKNLDNLL